MGILKVILSKCKLLFLYSHSPREKSSSLNFFTSKTYKFYHQLCFDSSLSSEFSLLLPQFRPLSFFLPDNIQTFYSTRFLVWLQLLPLALSLFHLVNSSLNNALTLHVIPFRRPSPLSPKRAKCLFLCVTIPPCSRLFQYCSYCCHQFLCYNYLLCVWLDVLSLYQKFNKHLFAK